MVMGVPESGLPAAEGFARASGIPYGQGLVKNRYIGRTFIAPSQDQRALGVRMKLNPLRDNIAGKRLVVVDDSIVRGTTPGDARAHAARGRRLPGPPPRLVAPLQVALLLRHGHRHEGELVAADLTAEEIREYLGVDTLAYLELDRLKEATGAVEAGFCDACLTGEYPVEVPVTCARDDPGARARSCGARQAGDLVGRCSVPSGRDVRRTPGWTSMPARRRSPASKRPSGPPTARRCWAISAASAACSPCPRAMNGPCSWAPPTAWVPRAWWPRPLGAFDTHRHRPGGHGRRRSGLPGAGPSSCSTTSPSAASTRPDRRAARGRRGRGLPAGRLRADRWRDGRAPGAMDPDDFDLVGFAVGVVERDRLITGEQSPPATSSSGCRPRAPVQRLLARAPHPPGASGPLPRRARLRGGARIARRGAAASRRSSTPRRWSTCSATSTCGVWPTSPVVACPATWPASCPTPCHAVVDRSTWEVPGIFAEIQRAGQVRRRRDGPGLQPRHRHGRGGTRARGCERRRAAGCPRPPSPGHRRGPPGRRERDALVSRAHQSLVDHLLKHSVKRGEFTLKSGRPSTWFIDAKQTACRPEGIVLVAEVALEVIPDRTDAIGGLTLGADPVAYGVAAVGATRGGMLRAFTVRKEVKDHGVRGRLAGALEPGDRGGHHRGRGHPRTSSHGGGRRGEGGRRRAFADHAAGRPGGTCAPRPRPWHSLPPAGDCPRPGLRLRRTRGVTQTPFSGSKYSS